MMLPRLMTGMQARLETAPAFSSEKNTLLPSSAISTSLSGASASSLVTCWTVLS